MPAGPAALSREGLREGGSALKAGGQTWANVLALLIPFLAGALLYAGTLRNEPVWDDVAFVFGQPFLMGCRGLLGVLDPRSLYWALPVEGAARPAWLASVLADSCLSGGAVPWYRLVNVLWHSAGAVLLTGLAWTLSGDRRLALAAGLLFAAHPLHTEPVNFIVDRSDLMAFAFMVLSLLLHLRGRAQRSGVFLASAAGSMACYALGLLSKEPAVVLPALVVSADVFFPVPGAFRRRRACFYAVLLLLTAAYLAFRAPRSGYVTEGHKDLFSRWTPAAPQAPSGVFDLPLPVEKEVPDRPPWSVVYKDPKTRLLTMSCVLGGYLRHLIVPWPLQGDYSVVPVASWLDPWPWAAWLGWGTVLAAAWRLRLHAPLAGFGLAWMALSFLPVSGIIAINNLRADRYAFLATAGACLALAAGLSRVFAGRRGGVLAAAGILAAAYGAMTVRRNLDFKDDETFFRSIVERDPSVARARFNLGGALARRGRKAEAQAEYREAVRLWPDFIQGRITLARLLLEEGRTEEALALLGSSHSLAPDRPHLLHYSRGAAFWALGRPWEAYQFFRSALRLKPAFRPAAAGAGIALLALDRAPEAIPYLRQALQGPLGGRAEIMRRLAEAYDKAGRPSEAERLRRELERLTPEAASGPRGPVKTQADLR